MMPFIYNIFAAALILGGSVFFFLRQRRFDEYCYLNVNALALILLSIAAIFTSYEFHLILSIAITIAYFLAVLTVWTDETIWAQGCGIAFSGYAILRIVFTLQHLSLSEIPSALLGMGRILLILVMACWLINQCRNGRSPSLNPIVTAALVFLCSNRLAAGVLLLLLYRIAPENFPWVPKKQSFNLTKNINQAEQVITKNARELVEKAPDLAEKAGNFISEKARRKLTLTEIKTLLDQLDSYFDMLQNGLLTQEEFEEKKKSLLAPLRPKVIPSTPPEPSVQEDLSAAPPQDEAPSPAESEAPPEAGKCRLKILYFNKVFSSRSGMYTLNDDRTIHRINAGETTTHTVDNGTLTIYFFVNFEKKKYEFTVADQAEIHFIGDSHNFHAEQL